MLPNNTDSCIAPRLRLVLGLAGFVALCLACAALGGFFAPGAWYAQLRKPAWNPPGWVFGPVWLMLYCMMGVAAWLVWAQGGFSRHKLALGLFFVQLLFNALWSPLCFGMQSLALGFVDICLLLIALSVTVSVFWRARRAAAVLLLPYLAWVMFAAVLNLTLWMLNP